MNITIVVVTHNRLEYTRKCLSHLLSDKGEEFDLYLWDNASNDNTQDFLKSIDDPRINEVILNKENLGQTGAMNYVWEKTKAELVGKLDNDCLVTPGWTRIFKQAHMDIDKLGAVACWHFPLEDFDENTARKAGKIQTFGKHQIFRHPWVCGSGFILKRSIYQECF
jgi:GT2 family glycosyltransferase